MYDIKYEINGGSYFDLLSLHTALKSMTERKAQNRHPKYVISFFEFRLLKIDY